MTVRILWVGLALLAIRQEPQVFRAGTNAVAAEATVRDGSRRVITGLTAADFEIYDNGIRQDIADVSYGRVPIDVTIALDVSYSVSGLMLDRLRRGVRQLMADLGSEDRLRLMLFNSRVARAIDFTTDTAAVERAIASALPGGGTSLLDTIGVAVQTAVPPDRRQLLVVFADGSDSTSITPPATLTNVALRSRTTITMVLPAVAVTPQIPRRRADDILKPYNSLAADNAARREGTVFVNPPRALESLFANLTTMTGGAIVQAPQTADLVPIFRQALASFRFAYVLYFQPRGVDLNGSHTVDIRVKRPGATVEARRGYWY